MEATVLRCSANLKFCKIHRKTPALESLNLILKRDSSTGVFLWILRKFSEYLFYWTPGQLLWSFHCNSLIKKNVSDFSTIGSCLVFFGNFVDKRLQLSLLFALRLQFIFKYLKPQASVIAKLATKPQTKFMHFFITTIQNCDNQLCFNENLFTYNGKTLDVESSATGYFVKKKILYLVQRNSSYCRIIFRGVSRNPAKYKMEHFATRLDTACRR